MSSRSTFQRRSASFLRSRVTLEALESRYLLSTIFVTNGDNSGTGSLSDAINAVNAGQYDTIDFNFSGTGPFVIKPSTSLPPITQKVLIDGTSQTGYAGTPIVLIDGSSSAHQNIKSFSFTAAAATGSVIKGLAITNFTGYGIQIQSPATGIAVTGNYIGLDTTGAAFPNAVGVSIVGSASNIIGGSTTPDRNVISGNTGPGIQISGTGSTTNKVTGNYIGVDPTGALVRSNSIGIQIDTSATGNSVGGSSTAQQNVISGNSQFDVLVDGASSNVITGNVIGLQADGLTALSGAPANSTGVGIQNNATLNKVGDSTSGMANVISGHTGATGAGIWVRGLTTSTGTAATANSILANIIGLASDGKTVRGNQVGVLLSDGTTQNIIGGATTGNGNTISGNLADGVQLTGASTSGNQFLGNFIGVAADGSSVAANGGNGILINGAVKTLVGGTQTGAGTTIANNGSNGIAVTTGTGNSFLRNSIYTNGALGILLDPSGSNPNNLQVAPVLTSVSSGGGTTVVNGTIQAAANSTYTVDLYSDPAPDSSGAGEGKTYLATAFVTTNASGAGTFTATSNSQVANGYAISGLATSSAGDTSQFAKNLTSSVVSTSVSISMTAAAVPPTTAGQVGTGSFLTYTVTVTNDGPEDATGVSVVDTLPTGVNFVGSTAPEGSMSQTGQAVTFNLGTIPKNTTQTFVITTVVPSAIPATNPIVNSSVVKIGPGVTNTSTNTTATTSTTVVASVDLHVSKVATPSSPVIGNDFSYVITVTNASSVQATNVVLTDVLPAGLTYVSATTTQGTVSESGGTITATIGSLPPTGVTLAAGYSAVVYVTVHPTGSGPFTNAATATAGQPQQVAGDNVGVSTVALVTAPVIPATSAVQITQVKRVGVHNHPAKLVLSFSQPLDSYNAQLLANYTLIAAQSNGKFSPIGSFIRLRSATYDATNHTVTLTPAKSWNFHSGVKLTVVGQPYQGVRGMNGLFLAGGSSGVSGTNYQAAFKGYGPKGA